MLGFPRRDRRGALNIGGLLLAAATFVLLVSSLLPSVLKVHTAPLHSSVELQFEQFANYFNRLAGRQAAANFDNTAFAASSLATNYPIAQGSNRNVSVTFEGCSTTDDLVRYNPLSPEQTDQLAATVAQPSPAQVIESGNGQTGGIVLNEPLARRLTGTTRLLRYRLSTPDTRTAISFILGREEQCR